MRLKVTVELEEGVKKTTECYLTTEAQLILNNWDHPKSLEDAIKREVVNAAERCIRSIFDFFKRDESIILTRSKNGIRECHRTYDIDEALQWLKDGDPKTIKIGKI